MSRVLLLWFILFVVLVMPPVSLRAKSLAARMHPIQFSQVSSDVAESGIHLSPREQWRIEHFLGAVFPVWQMRRYEREIGREPAAASFPDSRGVTYTLVSQQGFRFVLVGYRVEWNEAEASTTAVNELAIYRLDPDGPNQVWRSRPWQANYSGLDFRTVKYWARYGWRNVVLFQEGGAEGEFGLASVFSFYNEPDGLYLHDLTPEFPWLRARERFPFRTLYGQSISFRLTDARELILSASDEPYDLSMSRMVDTRRSWQFDKRRGRFAQVNEFTEAAK